ncbi:MAG TPA: S9 family peptidase [Steroidobacter sp.]
MSERSRSVVTMLMSIVALSIAIADARPLAIEDLDNYGRVADAQISPEGKSVLYTVTTPDVTADARRSSVWRVSWTGGVAEQLTSKTTSAYSARWSPDGRWISFLQSDAITGDAQLWLLDRERNGEARRITDLPGGISAYVWAPDSKRLALVHQAPAQKQPEPWVIDRYRFKSDSGDGYLHNAVKPPRIYLYDLDTRSTAALTSGGEFEESEPAWSPDGSRIAFFSNREADADRTDYADIYVASAQPGALPKRLTDFTGTDQGPLAWSADGRDLIFRRGGEPQYGLFDQLQLAVASVADGAVTLPISRLDRDVDNVAFRSDGRAINCLIIDNRTRYPASVSRRGGVLQRLYEGPRKILSFTEANGRIAAIATSDREPPEVYALERGVLRPLSHHNQGWLNEVQLSSSEEIEFVASDGQKVQGLLTRPFGYTPGTRYPTVLWIHGGPYLQDEHGFNYDPAYDARQVLAAQGYAVVQINYRGSRGNGVAFAHQTFAKWGERDVSDLREGVDHAVALGVADPNRLGVGGWSFGGILTNYLIVSDTRFKAAVSGAGSGSKISLYGTDLYAYVNELEFGAPWRSPDVWLRISRPLFQADRVRTPTLFVSGARDFNVPVAGSEQMYQALKSLRVPTQLVIYPGEHHMIERPSFERDLLRRYVSWYDRYLKDERSLP